MKTKTTKLTASDLEQFTGTEQYYKHWMGLHYTDGVKYMAEVAGAYWLLDIIASYRRREPLQIWTLKVNRESEPMAVVTMREDAGEPVKVRQEIPYTDFPLDEIKLYLIDGVILLPSEY